MIILRITDFSSQVWLLIQACPSLPLHSPNCDNLTVSFPPIRGNDTHARKICRIGYAVSCLVYNFAFFMYQQFAIKQKPLTYSGKFYGLKIYCLFFDMSQIFHRFSPFSEISSINGRIGIFARSQYRSGLHQSFCKGNLYIQQFFILSYITD